MQRKALLLFLVRLFFGHPDETFPGVGTRCVTGKSADGIGEPDAITRSDFFLQLLMME